MAEPACRQAGGRRTEGNKMFCVYVVKSKIRKYIYVGLTNDLERRLEQHQNGWNKTTKPYRPFELIHAENFTIRPEARNREKYLKSGAGKEWIKEHCLL